MLLSLKNDNRVVKYQGREASVRAYVRFVCTEAAVISRRAIKITIPGKVHFWFSSAWSPWIGGPLWSIYIDTCIAIGSSSF